MWKEINNIIVANITWPYGLLERSCDTHALLYKNGYGWKSISSRLQR